METKNGDYYVIGVYYWGSIPLKRHYNRDLNVKALKRKRVH